MSFLDNKKYTIKSSLGEGNTAAIPWLCIMHKQVTDSVTERFYVAYLFSRNAKKVFLSIGIGATQFSRIYGESMTKCVPKINDAKEQFKNTFLHLAPVTNFLIKNNFELINVDHNRVSALYKNTLL